MDIDVLLNFRETYNNQTSLSNNGSNKKPVSEDIEEKKDFKSQLREEMDIAGINSTNLSLTDKMNQSLENNLKFNLDALDNIQSEYNSQKFILNSLTN